MPITALYVGLSALLLLYFSVAVIRCRVQHKVVLFDGGVDILARHCRAHANFTEYTPMVLLLIAMGEMGGASSTLLHGMGAALIAGRIVHFYSLTVREPRAASAGNMDIRFRQAGMMLTFVALGTGAITALWLSMGSMMGG
jgi:uncharacterized protein